MNLLVGRKSWLLAPAMFVAGLVALAITWAAMEPAALRAAFDADGKSFFETITLPFYALIVPLVWLACPFGGSLRRKALLCAAVSCVAFMAVVKETDLHVAFISWLYPDVVAGFKGTPFKMRFLTNGAVPFGAKCVALAYFALFFGVFALLLIYFARQLLTGVFKLHPVAWTVGCLGASGVMVQIFDRLPAWYRHVCDLPRTDEITPFISFCTAFEEGGELMIAAFGLLAILQAHAIYAPDKPDSSLSA